MNSPLETDPPTIVFREDGDRRVPLTGKSTLNRPELTPVRASKDGRYRKIVAGISGLQHELADLLIRLRAKQDVPIELTHRPECDRWSGASQSAREVLPRGRRVTPRCGIAGVLHRIHSVALYESNIFQQLEFNQPTTRSECLYSGENLATSHCAAVAYAAMRNGVASGVFASSSEFCGWREFIVFCGFY